MSRLRKKTRGLPVLVSLLIAFCGFQTQAAVDDSWCDSSGTLSLRNINLKGGRFAPGQVLQQVSAPLAYSCTYFPALSGPPYTPHLVITKDFAGAITTLREVGLGLELTFQTGGNSGVFTWKEIQDAVFSGRSVTKAFGSWAPRPPRVPEKHDYNGTMTMRLFAARAFDADKPWSINVGRTSSFQITAYNPAGLGYNTGTPVTTTPFSVQFIPDNAGRVEVSPSLVRLGHFYTSRESSLSKRVSFTVTARQKIGAYKAFTAPLAVKFSTGGLVLREANQAVALSNDDGTLNGLKLSLEYGAGEYVTFNESESMGDIHMKTSGDGSISRTYTAVVERIPGADIRTGKFSAPMTVIVTWN